MEAYVLMNPIQDMRACLLSVASYVKDYKFSWSSSYLARCRQRTNYYKIGEMMTEIYFRDCDLILNFKILKTFLYEDTYITLY